jgi:hypothetical protein
LGLTFANHGNSLHFNIEEAAERCAHQAEKGLSGNPNYAQVIPQDQQHYLDFPNREPDQSGLDYWTAQITQCGTDELCLP